MWCVSYPYFLMARCYVCVKQGNVNVCRHVCKILTSQVFLFINTHLCSFLSQIHGLCVSVCACVRLCEVVCVCGICSRLGYNAALSGNSAMTFRDNPSVPSSKFKTETLACPETSERNYQSTPRYIAEKGGLIYVKTEA